MAQNTGTIVIAPIRPNDSADTYPSHESIYGKGGWREVQTVAERDAIPTERRSSGMAVFVTADQVLYLLNLDMATWTAFNLSFSPVGVGVTEEFTVAAGTTSIVLTNSFSQGVILGVYINGLKQQTADFTATAPRTITFSEAILANNSKIKVEFGIAQSLTQLMASSVNVNDAGGFYLSSTVEGVLQEVGADIAQAQADIDSLEAFNTNPANSVPQLRTDLANPAAGFGADLVANTVESAKLTSYGAAGNGVTSDQTALNTALASGKKTIFADDEKTFLVTSLDNPFGLEIEGKGVIGRAITGGLQQLNTYADKRKVGVGKEYLSRVYGLLNTAASTNVFCYGDSTVEGNSQSTFSLLQNLIPAQARRRGLRCTLNVTNRGVSGTDISDFNALPDLGPGTSFIIVKYGINDGLFSRYPEATRLATFQTTLRAKLAAIRADSNGAEAQVSILLVGPNATNDTPNGRDERWYEQLRGIYVQAARDFRCAYFDTYGYLKDSRFAANLWMDDPFGDGRAIHPNDIGHNWIWGAVFEWVFGWAETAWLRRNHFLNIPSSGGNAVLASLPTTYEFGNTWQRALVGDGWPVDGAVATFRHPDGTFAMQINWPNGNTSRAAFRTGTTAWGAFSFIGGNTVKATPGTGYTLPGGTADMRIAISGTTASIEGYVAKTAPSTIPANTVVATSPGGYRPIVDSLYGVNITAFDGSVFQTVQGRITNAGNIETLAAISLVATRVYVTAAWSLQPNV